MDWMAFLTALENTLNEIEVKGKQNNDHLMGCFIAIDRAKEFLMQQPPVEKDEGGEDNGRQTDIGFNDSNANKE